MAKKKSKPTKKKQTSLDLPTIKNIVIGLLVVLVVVLLVTKYSVTPPQDEEVVIEIVEPEAPEPEPIVEEVIVIEEDVMTLSDYLADASQYVNAGIEVQAYLKHGSYVVDTALGKEYGIYTEMLTDGTSDLPVIGLNTAQKRLFPNRATTDDMYTVAGTLRNLSDGLRLDVENIE